MPRIGFNTVAARDKFYAGGAVPECRNELGPGSYDLVAPRNGPARPAYVPFNTSAGQSCRYFFYPFLLRG